MVLHGGVSGAECHVVKSLGDSSHGGDVDGLFSDGSAGSDSGGVFSGAAIDHGVD